MPDSHVRGHQDESDPTDVHRRLELGIRAFATIVRQTLTPGVELPLCVRSDGAAAAGQRSARPKRPTGLVGPRGQRRVRLAVVTAVGRTVWNHDHRLSVAHDFGNVHYIIIII